jgi:hypothetical protein
VRVASRGLAPSPLVGEGWGGRVSLSKSSVTGESHPPPCPSPQGGGDSGVRAFATKDSLVERESAQGEATAYRLDVDAVSSAWRPAAYAAKRGRPMSGTHSLRTPSPLWGGLGRGVGQSAISAPAATGRVTHVLSHSKVGSPQAEHAA